MSPLHMALVTASVVNGGKMPKPYLVGAVRAADGSLLQGEPRADTWLTPIKPESADKVRQLMLATVDNVYPQAKVDGVLVGGKTGTAETGAGEPHAWFTCFAGPPNGAAELVVAVVVEQGGAGSRAALPIATEVVKAYYANR